MDPVRNPYAPGAGTPPPELAGRNDLLQSAEIALKRVAAGRPHQSMIMVGLRGVGKTVLLNRIDMIARNERFKSLLIEAHEGKRLPELIVPSIRSILYSLSNVENAKEKARYGLRVLKSFVSSLKISLAYPVVTHTH